MNYNSKESCKATRQKQKKISIKITIQKLRRVPICYNKLSLNSYYPKTYFIIIVTNQYLDMIYLILIRIYIRIIQTYI